MSSSVDRPGVDEGEQLCLFEFVKRSTFNPPAQLKRSVADWLTTPTTTTTNSTNVKEGTA